MSFSLRLPPRRFHAYGVGMAKSGTNSVASIFGTYRSAHEPDTGRTIETVLAYKAGTMSESALHRWLVARDRKLHLEMDSSQLNYFFSAQLAQIFPQAKFVLTIRDCYTWLDSLINHQLSRPASREWTAMRDLRFGRNGAVHPPEEQVLAEHSLYTLDGYLSYWAAHNRTILELIPHDRLLVVSTSRLDESFPAMAKFLGVECDTLDRDNSHKNQAVQKLGLLHRIDPDYLDAKVALYGKDLMREFFPDITAVRDAPLH